MRKAIYSIFIAVMIFATVFSSSVKNEAFADVSDNAVIVMKGEITEQEIVVKAYLRQNTGINGMTAEISYDTSAMTLKNIERGTALSSLDYITTNIDTEKGYAITPFKINWSGDENDDSTGLLITMHFTVNETATNGEYKITLKTDKTSVTYIDGEVKTKSALVDGVKITIKGSSPETIVTETNENANENTSKIFMIVSLCVAAVTIVVFTVVLIVKLRGKKAWTKIE